MCFIQKVKSASRGRCNELLPSLGMDIEKLIQCVGAFPNCGKSSSVYTRKSFNDDGKLYCRNCLESGTGDIAGTVAWIRRISQGEAARIIASQFNIDIGAKEVKDNRDIIDEVCRAKKMPRSAFEQFGVKAAKRKGEFVARVQVYNDQGKPSTYFDLTPTTKGKFACGNSWGMFLPGIQPSPKETWLLVEGVKDASALLALGYKVAGLPSSYIPATAARLFRDCDIVIVPDLDLPGQKGAKRTAARLIGIASRVRIARLPGEVVAKQGPDVRDVLASNGKEAVIRAIDDAFDWTAEDMDAGSTQDVIEVDHEEAQVAMGVTKRLGDLGWNESTSDAELARVYTRGGKLVSIVPIESHRDTGRYKIHELSHALIRERITQACELVETLERSGSSIQKRVRPPEWLIKAIYERSYYHGCVRSLTGILEAPTLRADGTVLQTPGWDRETGYVYKPLADFPEVPSNPTREDAIAAANRLLDIVCDFPFVSPSDRTSWLAMLLTIVGRVAVDGCTPMFGISANTRGTGKGRLASITWIIAFGRDATADAWPNDPGEQQAKITTIVLEDRPAILWDNIDGEFGAPPLDIAITSRIYSDRIKGHSRSTGELPMRVVFVATGNNLEYKADTFRRVVPIRLHSPEENPEARVGFKHPDLVRYVSENRHQFLIDTLVILRAFALAGWPNHSGGAFGSFEEWDRLIRGAIVWLGLPDPMAVRNEMESQDSSKMTLRLIHAAMKEVDPENNGISMASIKSMLESTENPHNRYPAMVQLVSDVCGSKFCGRRLGKTLGKFQGTVLGGYFLRGVDVSNVKRWRLVPEGKQGLNGFVSPRSSCEPDEHSFGSIISEATETDTPPTNPLNPSNPEKIDFDAQCDLPTEAIL